MNGYILLKVSLRKKCPNTEFFLVRIFLNSVRILENTDQRKLRIWTLFTQWIILYQKILHFLRKTWLWLFFCWLFDFFWLSPINSLFSIKSTLGYTLTSCMRALPNNISPFSRSALFIYPLKTPENFQSI